MKKIFVCGIAAMLLSASACGNNQAAIEASIKASVEESAKASVEESAKVSVEEIVNESASMEESIFSDVKSESIDDLIIGTWIHEREPGEDRIDEPHWEQWDIYEGHTIFARFVTESGKEYMQMYAEWKVEGDILIISTGMGTVGYIIDVSKTPYTMTSQTDSSYVIVKEE